MSIGMDDHRVPPKFLLEKDPRQVKQLAEQKPEDSPLSMPLKKFPASIPPPDQERIRKEMLLGHRQAGAAGLWAPGALPRGELYPCRAATEPGISALPDGARVLPVPHPAHHHDRSDCRSDPPDRAGRGEAQRSRRTGHRAEAWVPGSEDVSRQPEDRIPSCIPPSGKRCWMPTADI